MGKILLVNQHNNTWSFPKGGIEEGENELEAAKREIVEEAGIRELEHIDDLGSYERYSIAKDGVHEQTERGQRKRIFFLFKTAETETGGRTDPTAEITDTKWVTVDEALALLTHPKDKEFLESVRDKIEKWM